MGSNNANARVLGSYQSDSFRSHKHEYRTGFRGTNIFYAGQSNGDPFAINDMTTTHDISTKTLRTEILEAGGTETRGENVALAPRIIAY